MSACELIPFPKNLFLHVCCGPCAVWPLKVILTESPDTSLFLWFYNPNIQPLTEYRRRRDAWAYAAGLLRDMFIGHKIARVEFSPDYDQGKFLALAAQNPDPPDRCQSCYDLRLEAAAREAAGKGYESFTTTLLFSRQQKHELIINAGQKAAEKTGLNFYYRDFRRGWAEGRLLAKEMGLYRQNYCGCIYGLNEQG
jgi:predicted adenine nucleotide alpha hydrolase (AANH) superfamily ATPase